MKHKIPYTSARCVILTSNYFSIMVKRKGCITLDRIGSNFEIISSSLISAHWIAIFSLMALLLSGCEEHNKEEKGATQTGNENPNAELPPTNEVQNIINQQDTIQLKSGDSTNEEPTDKSPKRSDAKPKPNHEEKSIPKTQPEDGATRHYFKSGKLAVKVDPWSERMQRSIHFYNRAGEEIFTLEDIQQSYSVRTELSFHENGAARLAEISENPGASQYWYKTQITFDEDNYPMQRTSQRMPYEDLQATMKKPEMWNRERRAWEMDVRK